MEIRGLKLTYPLQLFFLLSFPTHTFHYYLNLLIQTLTHKARWTLPFTTKKLKLPTHVYLPVRIAYRLFHPP